MVARFNRKGNLRASIRGASNGESPRFFVSWDRNAGNQTFRDTIWRRSAKAKTMSNQIMSFSYPLGFHQGLNFSGHRFTNYLLIF